MKAKYVIVQHQGLQVPVLFPELMGGVEHREAAKIGHPVSAGFCESVNGAWSAWGESAGLGLRSRQTHDAEILRRFFGTGVAEHIERAPNTLAVEG